MPTAAEIRAELDRRKRMTMAPAATPVSQPAANPAAEAIRAELARRKTQQPQPAPQAPPGSMITSGASSGVMGAVARSAAAKRPQDQDWTAPEGWDASEWFLNRAGGQERRGPSAEDLAAMAAEEAAKRKADSEALARSVGEMGVGGAGYSIAPNETGQKLVQGDVNRMLPARFGAAAVNAAGPGSVNATLEIADAAFGPGPAFDFMGNPLEFREPKKAMSEGNRLFEAPPPEPVEMLPTIQMDQAIGEAEGGADFGGTLTGVFLGPGKAVPKEAGLGRVAADIGAKGTLGAKAAGYGTRMAGNLAENIGYAGLVGANMAPEGQRAEMAGQFAADPLTWAVGPFASAIYRGSIALKTMGNRVTPEAIQIQQAVRTLQAGNATPAQMQAAAQTIDQMTPPAPDAPPAAQGQPQAAPVATQTAQQAQQAQPTPTAPPPATQAAQPPVAPVQAAQQAAPPPGTLTPTVPGQGFAVDSFNALPVKTREAMLRAMAASGMSRDQAFDAIRSLNDLPPERANMFEAELIRRFGGPDQFPNLKTNLTAMGSDFSIQVPGRGGDPQGVMNRSLLDQAKSEGEYLERMAEQIFGPGKVATKADLEQYREVLGGRYRKLLSEQYPGASQKRGANRLAEQQRIDGARSQLATYLKRPDVMENVPAWVQDEVMLQVSADLRRMKFTPDEQAIILRGNPELAPLFTPDRELIYSPRLWATLADLYPTQVGHSLQSAYRSAIDSALKGTDAAQRTVAKRLMRMRGQSKVRANAANPDQRGFGLLYLLEDAVPGYKTLRQEFGDVAGAQKAADMPDSFFRVAGDEEALADFIAVFDDELTPLQQEAVRNGITTQIRQALRNKTDFTDLTELDQAARLGLPNLTKITSRPFLEALPKVFGADGERMVDAIRLSRANVDNIGSINASFRSGTPKGMEIRQNARNIYENPSATDANPIDAATSTLAGVGGLAAMTGSLQVAAPVLGGAALRGLYRMYKRGKSLTPGQKEALAEWLFKPRRATDAPPPTTPTRFSRAGYAGNVATGAAIGAAAGATSGDPNAIGAGAITGAFGGATRAGLRARRADRSIIKPPPAPRNAPAPNNAQALAQAISGEGQPRQLPGQTSQSPGAIGGAILGGGAGYALAPEDQKDAAALVGAILGGVGGAKLAKAASGPKAPPKPMAPVGGKGAEAKVAGIIEPTDKTFTPNPSIRNMDYAEQLDYIRAKYPPVSPTRMSPYLEAANKIALFKGDRDAAFRYLRDFYESMRRKPRGKYHSPELMEQMRLAANAVYEVDPIFFDDVASARNTLSNTGAKAETLFEAIRRSKPDDGIGLEMSAQSKLDDMLEAERGGSPSKPPTNPERMGMGGKTKPAPPPPPSRKPTPIKNAAGRAAVGGALGAMVGGDAQSQTPTAAEMADAQAQMAKIQETIDSLQSVLDIYDKGTPAQIQEAVSRGGEYTKPDGIMGPDTVARVKADRLRIAAEMKTALEELDKTRSRIKTLEERQAFEQTRPNTAQQAWRQGAPWIGALIGIFAGGKSRSGAVKEAHIKALEDVLNANKLLTPGPIKKPRTIAERDALKEQPARINQFWRKGGAGDNVPFDTNQKGDWIGRPKAKVATPSSLYPQKTTGLRANDYAWIAAGLGEAGLSTIGVDMAHKEIAAAQAALDQEKSKENYERLERAHDILGLAEAAQRFGFAFAGYRAIGAWKKPYKTEIPDIKAAEAERVKMLEYLQRLKK